MSEEIFPEHVHFSSQHAFPKFLYLNFFNLKFFNVFLVKLLNEILVDQNKNMDILYKKKFQSSPTLFLVNVGEIWNFFCKEYSYFCFDQLIVYLVLWLRIH